MYNYFNRLYTNVIKKVRAVFVKMLNYFLAKMVFDFAKPLKIKSYTSYYVLTRTSILICNEFSQIASVFLTARAE